MKWISFLKRARENKKQTVCEEAGVISYLSRIAKSSTAENHYGLDLTSHQQISSTESTSAFRNVTC